MWRSLHRENWPSSCNTSGPFPVERKCCFFFWNEPVYLARQGLFSTNFPSTLAPRSSFSKKNTYTHTHTQTRTHVTINNEQVKNKKCTTQRQEEGETKKSRTRTALFILCNKRCISIHWHQQKVRNKFLLLFFFSPRS